MSEDVGGRAGWRRVHPLSPLLRMWAVLVGVAAVVLAQQAETLGRLRDWITDSPLPGAVLVPAAVGVLTVVLLVGWAVSWPWWRATGWRVDAEEIAVRRGVLSRTSRTARFDRVQAVDLVEPLAPRLFRLAGVRVETAGGAGSAVSVEYLPRAEAEDLRAALLRRVRGERDAPDVLSAVDDPRVSGIPRHGAGTPAAGDGTVVVPPVPVARSVAAAALTGQSAATVVAVAVSVCTPAGLALLVPALAGLGPWLWGLLNRSWRFTARTSGEAGDRLLGITFGFSERRRQTVPLTRIHAVAVSQPLLWRFVGWWRVDVTVAGYGDPSAGGSTTTVLPVGSLDQALTLVALLGPLDRAEVETLVRPDAPGAPGDGASGAATVAGVPGTRFYRSPASARWVSPVDRRRQTVVVVPGTTDTCSGAVVCHRGRLRRSAAVIAPAHIQELSLRRGPAHRVLGLATVRFDLVPGPVSMAGRDLSASDARDLVERLRHRSLPAPVPVTLPLRREGVPPVC